MDTWILEYFDAWMLGYLVWILGEGIISHWSVLASIFGGLLAWTVVTNSFGAGKWSSLKLLAAQSGLAGAAAEGGWVGCSQIL